MPFSSAFAEHPILERAVRVRRNHLAGFAISILLVGLAAFSRWLLAGVIGDGVPFITFYSAIILATFLGGLWPGVLAALLSSLIAWYGYLPSQGGPLAPQELVSLLVFLGVSGINIGLVTVLNLAMDRVVAQHENVRFLMDSAPNGIVVVDAEGQIKLVNARAEELFGYKHDELVGLSVDLLVPENAQDAHREYRAEFHRAPEARAMGAGRDLSGRRKDGSEFPVEIGLNPISREGRNAVLTTVIDISERRLAQDRQRFLVRELQHRTQNLFQVIRAVAERSLTDGQLLSEARTVLLGRLHALAQAHQALADAAWEGAHLDLILRRTLSSFRTSCTIEGCNVTVNTTAAQNFALIANELATNAAKYGALSVVNGEVAIRGRVQQNDSAESFFLFSWQERGGPPVVAPKRKGFGTVVLTELAKQFGQFVALEYDPHGLKYELHVPMSTLAPTRTDAGFSTLKAVRS